MNKAGNKRGMCHKDGAYEPRGLSRKETRKIISTHQADTLRWKHLLSLNKWKPI